MKFERRLIALGGSSGVTFPSDLLKFLKLQLGDKIVVEDKENDHGPYVRIYKKNKTGGADGDSGTTD